MENDELRHIRIGDWDVQPRAGKISRGAHEVRLPPKFMQVLVALAAADGGVVTREELLDRVWPDTVVGEAVLTRAISELRKAFASADEGSDAIETIPKVGYRLLWPVASVDAIQDYRPMGAVPGRRWWRWLVAALVVIVVAVVLFWQRDAPPPPLRQQPVTSLSGEEFDPAFSPDGRVIAFARVEVLEGQADIFMKRLDQTDVTRITDSPELESSPTWSNDGQHVAFVRCDPATGRAGIHSVSVQSPSDARELVSISVPHCMAVPSIVWAPDGSGLLYGPMQGGNEPAGLVWLELPSRAESRLTSPPAGMRDMNPRFSPDGRRVAFARGRDPMSPRADILVMDVRGTDEPRVVRAEVDGLNGFDWTADGEALVIASRGDLWRVDVLMGTRTYIASPGTDIGQPVVSPATGQLIFVHSLYDVNVWSLDVDTHEARPTMASTRVDNEPRISPDGRRVAFISDRDGTCSLLTVNRDGSGPTPLATFDANCLNVTSPRWSPDGFTVAFTMVVDDNEDVYVVSTAGGPVRRLTDHPGTDAAPGWSADSRFVYVSSDRSGSTDVWKVAVDGSAPPERITDFGAKAASESLDGAWLYMAVVDEPGLWRMSTRGGQVERIIDDLDVGDHRNWRVSASGITYIVRNPEVALMRWTASTGQSVSVTVLPTSLRGCLTADLSPDGSFAVFAQVDRDEDDLFTLENFR